MILQKDTHSTHKWPKKYFVRYSIYCDVIIYVIDVIAQRYHAEKDGGFSRSIWIPKCFYIALSVLFQSLKHQWVHANNWRLERWNGCCVLVGWHLGWFVAITIVRATDGGNWNCFYCSHCWRSRAMALSFETSSTTLPFLEIFNQIWSFFRHFRHFDRQAAKQKEINDVVSKCVVNTPDSEIYRGVCLSAINGFCPSTIKRSQNLSHISKAEEMIFWDGF